MTFRTPYKPAILYRMTASTWTCRCGEVAFDVTLTGGTRAVCYCESCRAFVKALGADDILDPAGGNDLFQIAPEAATCSHGHAHLAWTKLTAKGPARWFTTCCHTPLANTLDTRAFPFLTLQSAFISDQSALGPIDIRVNRDSAAGTAPTAKAGMGRLIREFALRALKSRLSGGWRRNPLFDATGAPIGPQTPLPPNETA